jgi:hypothetical protein
MDDDDLEKRQRDALVYMTLSTAALIVSLVIALALF